MIWVKKTNIFKNSELFYNLIFMALWIHSIYFNVFTMMLFEKKLNNFDKNKI